MVRKRANHSAVMCDCYQIGYVLESDTDDEVWQMDSDREEFLWALQEIWGMTLPDEQTLEGWRTSNLKYTDVFNTRTLFREFGVRGRGTLYVNTDDWRLLTEAAHQYADMHQLQLENVTCCMAQWFLN